MCGRFSLTRPAAELMDVFGIIGVPVLAPRYNIAPRQPVAVVRAGAQGRELVALRWGLVPSWTKEPPKDARLINARAEGIADKPSFRAAFRRRRCLVPADGFYEWKPRDGRKQPYYIRFEDARVFAFAGLWEHWQGPAGEVVESCTVITTTANTVLRPLHERMPVILDPPDYGAWLGETPAEVSALTALLAPYPAGSLVAYPVSTRVNSPRNDDPGCVAPAADAGG